MKSPRILAAGTLCASLVFGFGCSSDDAATSDTSLNDDNLPLAIPARPADIAIEQDTLEVGEFGAPGAPLPASPGEWTRLDKEKMGFPTIYFSYDQDRIGASESAKLDAVAEYMGKHGNVGVIIEGHCDERGNDEYNRSLGERRSISVKDYLIENGVAADNIKTVSFGEERPAVEGADEAAWSKNRRAELVPCKK